jgi:hypothetical protein
MSACRGNYLAFFSSFEYLQQVARLLAEQHGQIPLWAQEPGMDEAPARHSSIALSPMAEVWASPYWAVLSAKGWTCRARG